MLYHSAYATVRAWSFADALVDLTRLLLNMYTEVLDAATDVCRFSGKEGVSHSVWVPGQIPRAHYISPISCSEEDISSRGKDGVF